jgi:hypothetical protein
MPDAIDPPTDATDNNAEPLPDQTTLFPDCPSGEPMPDPTDETHDAPSHGDPNPDQTALFPEIPTTGEPMPDLPTESQRELMTDDDAVPDTVRMLTPEDAARAVLHGIACELGHDEVCVLARIAERLRGGRDAYGPLQLSTDTRRFRSQEAREELEDALVYLACAWLKAEEAR